MTDCPTCGTTNEIRNKFCGQCGAVLVADIDHTGVIGATSATSGSLPAVGVQHLPNLAPDQAVLIVQRGPSQGSEFILGDTDLVGLGRSPDSEIFLDDVTVSRRHAELRRGAEGWSIRDVGSLNGTYVNRVRVEDQRLVGGEEIQIGKFRFLFLLGSET
jgi:hypothetical protein